MKPVPDLRELMKQPMISVQSATQVFDALQVARDHGVHHLAVSESNDLCGIVCTCDLRDAALNTPVAAIMRRTVVTVNCDASVRQAAALMIERKVGSVVVTNGSNRALGIVTRQDISSWDAGLSALMSECRCAACGTMEHLRIGRDGDYICLSCLDRVEPDGWFDLGTGD